MPGGLRAASYWMLAIVFAAVFLGSLFSPPLLDDADSTHAEAAREMFVTGDYVTLHVNGVRYLEKAPLPYWLVVASYHLFGIHEFSTRLAHGAFPCFCSACWHLFGAAAHLASALESMPLFLSLRPLECFYSRES